MIRLVLRSLLSLVLASNLLFTSLLPGIGWLELGKIPLLVDHYQKHLDEEGTSISLIDFLELHYSPSSHHDEPEHESQLPQWTFQSGQFFVASNLQVVEYINAPLSEITHRSIYTDNYSLTLVEEITNPPKA